MRAQIHGRGLRQSSALQHAIGMTVKNLSCGGRERKDIVNGVHELAHPFVDVIVLQLNEASADGSDVALLIGEGHTAGSLWVFELRVGVDASVANTSVQPVHDHSQLHWRGGVKKTGSEIISATVRPLFFRHILAFLLSSAFLKKTQKLKGLTWTLMSDAFIT